jgi:hypothetical protein
MGAPQTDMVYFGARDDARSLTEALTNALRVRGELPARHAPRLGLADRAERTRHGALQPRRAGGEETPDAGGAGGGGEALSPRPPIP